jgi:hypothetical protein
MCAQVQLELCQVLQACLLCYACQRFDYTVCRDCWYDKHANKHRHRSFLSVEPPTGAIANTNEGLASHCCQKPAFYHCNSCLNRECVSLCPQWPKLLTLDSALKLSQRVSLCKTRYIQFSERVFHCENFQHTILLIMLGPGVLKTAEMKTSLYLVAVSVMLVRPATVSSSLDSCNAHSI